MAIEEKVDSLGLLRVKFSSEISLWVMFDNLFIIFLYEKGFWVLTTLEFLLVILKIKLKLNNYLLFVVKELTPWAIGTVPILEKLFTFFSFVICGHEIFNSNVYVTMSECTLKKKKKIIKFIYIIAISTFLVDSPEFTNLCFVLRSEIRISTFLFLKRVEVTNASVSFLFIR